jgi:hypothetical protein
LTAVRSALIEWSINLGEGCRQIEEGNFTRASNNTSSSTNKDTGNSHARNTGEILMLCERSLYLLKGYLLLGCSVISVSFIICMLTLLLMPLAGLH